MTTLHAIPGPQTCLCHWPEPEERVTMPDCPIHPMPVPPPEPEPPAYRCPNEHCTGRDEARWYRNETGTYTETHWIRLAETNWDNEGWDNMDQEMHDASPWKCWMCDTEATDEIAEYIDTNQ